MIKFLTLFMIFFTASLNFSVIEAANIQVNNFKNVKNKSNGAAPKGIAEANARKPAETNTNEKNANGNDSSNGSSTGNADCERGRREGNILSIKERICP